MAPICTNRTALFQITFSLLFIVLNHTMYAQKFESLFPKPKNANTYIIAHRGAHNIAPENTLAAYQKAIDLGCDFIEIDLRKTKDGHFVSIHNESIDAYVVGKSGKVKDFTLSELKQMRLKNQNSKEELIPTLEEILQLCKGKIGIYLDLKEPDVKRQVQIIKSFKMEKRVVWYIPASLKKVIKAVKKYCAECAVMPDPGPIKNLSNVLNRIKPTVIASDMHTLSADFVTLAHSKEAKVFVDDNKATEIEWQQILDWGTDGIQTDKPEELINFLNREK